jgi:hypothetical protein
VTRAEPRHFAGATATVPALDQTRPHHRSPTTKEPAMARSRLITASLATALSGAAVGAPAAVAGGELQDSQTSAGAGVVLGTFAIGAAGVVGMRRRRVARVSLPNT